MNENAHARFRGANEPCRKTHNHSERVLGPVQQTGVPRPRTAALRDQREGTSTHRPDPWPAPAPIPPSPPPLPLPGPRTRPCSYPAPAPAPIPLLPWPCPRLWPPAQLTAASVCTSQWHLHEFLVAWNALVPDEFQPEFEWLRVRRIPGPWALPSALIALISSNRNRYGRHVQGLAVVDTDAAGNEVASYFPLDALPRDPARRFEQLFAKRAKWTLDDLRPYLQYDVATLLAAARSSPAGCLIGLRARTRRHRDLAADSKSMDALLLKHTRMSSHPTQKDLKLYSSR